MIRPTSNKNIYFLASLRKYAKRGFSKMQDIPENTMTSWVSNDVVHGNTIDSIGRNTESRFRIKRIKLRTNWLTNQQSAITHLYLLPHDPAGLVFVTNPESTSSIRLSTFSLRYAFPMAIISFPRALNAVGLWSVLSAVGSWNDVTMTSREAMSRNSNSRSFGSF